MDICQLKVVATVLQQCHFIDWHCCGPAPSKPDVHLLLAHDPLVLALVSTWGSFKSLKYSTISLLVVGFLFCCLLFLVCANALMKGWAGPYCWEAVHVYIGSVCLIPAHWAGRRTKRKLVCSSTSYCRILHRLLTGAEWMGSGSACLCSYSLH